MKHYQNQGNHDDLPSMNRRQQAKQKTRLKLLEAAHDLFVERGYESATIRDIAAGAHLSTGAVFANFSDKADLFNEVILADFRRLDELMAAASGDGPLKAQLQRLLTLACDSHLGRPRLVQSLLSFSWTDHIRADGDGRVNGVKLVLDRLAGVLRQGVERGELPRGFDVRLTSEMLWDCHVSNYRRVIFDGWTPEALGQRLADQIELLICARPRKAA